MALQVNSQDIADFYAALFVYADEGTFVSLRAFDQNDRGQPPVLIEAVKVNGDSSILIGRAVAAAGRAANASRPAVFAPPVATFNNAKTARGEDVANGVALSVEIDAGDPTIARRRLEHLLGPATIAVLSGGEWIDSETGEIHAKMHLHWRLSEPTREAIDHAKLRDARWLAATLVGADTTAAPPAHPLRWPGSWNLKTVARIAKVAGGNPAAEINLDEALERLQEAVEAEGLRQVATVPKQSSDPTGRLDMVRSAMEALPNADLHWEDWNRIGMACWRATAGTPDGLVIWADWSAKSDKHEEAGCATRWAHYAISPPTKIGVGTLYHLAAQAGWVRPQAQSEPPPDGSTDPGWWHSLEQSLLNGAEVAEVVGDAPKDTSATKEPSLDGRIIVPPRDWTAPAPLREWIVDGWIPRGYVTGIYGDGAVGKSLIVQQLITSVSCVKPWLGMDVRGGRAFGFMCEDDAKELHRRQEGINRAYGLAMPNLEFMRLAARFGFDNILMTFDDRNRGSPTELFAEVAKFLTAFPPTLVVLDTLADIFGGNEIVRAHARQFIQGIGGQLARQFNCAVVIAAHPSASGISTGSGAGGSTAWSNTFRSRLYMTRPEGEGNDDVRHLSRMKANYAPKGGEIVVKWSDGAFMPAQKDAAGNQIAWEHIRAIFCEIDRAWHAEDAWSNAPQTKREGRYLPLWAAVHLGLQERLVASYLDRWLAGGYLKSEIIDTRSKRRGLAVAKWLQPPVAGDDAAEVC